MRSNDKPEQHGQRAEIIYYDSNDMMTASGVILEGSVIAHFKKPCSAKAGSMRTHYNIPPRQGPGPNGSRTC